MGWQNETSILNDSRVDAYRLRKIVRKCSEINNTLQLIVNYVFVMNPIDQNSNG